MGRGAESSRGDKDAVSSSSLFAFTCAQAAPNPITQHRRHPPFPLSPCTPATRASHVHWTSQSSSSSHPSIIVCSHHHRSSHHSAFRTATTHHLKTVVHKPPAHYCPNQSVLLDRVNPGKKRANQPTLISDSSLNMTWTCQNYGCQNPEPSAYPFSPKPGIFCRCFTSRASQVVICKIRNTSNAIHPNPLFAIFVYQENRSHSSSLLVERN